MTTSLEKRKNEDDLKIKEVPLIEREKLQESFEFSF